MNPMVKCRILIFLLMATIISCEFETDEIYEVNIQESSPEEDVIDLRGIIDTLILSEQNMYHYDIVLKESSLYSVEIKLNNEVVFTSEKTSDHFSLDPEGFSSGIYSLEILANTSSGNGSLADVVGAEGYIYSRKWVVLIDVDVPNPLKILDIIPEEGSLKITWEKYTRTNFYKYEIYKVINHDYFIKNMQEMNWNQGPIAEIYDQEITSYYDSSYVGEDAEYQIRVYSDLYSYSSPEYRAIGESMTIQGTMPQIKNTSSSQDNMVISWSKCNFPSNFVEYNLYITKESNPYTNKVELIHTSTNINDTVYTTNKIPFGSYVNLIIGTLSKPMGEFDAHEIKDGLTSYLGKESFNYNQAKTTLNDEYIFYWNGTKLCRYSIIEQTNIEEISFTYFKYGLFTISLNSEYLICGDNTKIYKIDPLDFTNIKEYTNIDIHGNSVDNITNIEIADNGIAAISSENSFAIYNFATDSLHLLENENRRILEISSNGKYLFEYASPSLLLEFNNGQIDTVNTFYSWLDEVAFNPRNANELYYYDYINKKLIAYNCETTTIKNQFSIQSRLMFHIDPITGYIVMDDRTDDYWEDPTYYKIFDMATGRVIKRYRSYDHNYYMFFNSTIYTSGYKLELTL